MKNKDYKGTALDLVETVYMEEYTPVVYGFIRFRSTLDIDRLHNAVRRSAQTVPQIFCLYSYEHHKWIPAGFNTDSIIHFTTFELQHDTYIWDLQTGPQLKINVFRNDQQDSIQICMSHILADGAGLLQYLYLLCSYYNNPRLLVPAKMNSRRMAYSIFRTIPYRLRYLHNEQLNEEATVLLPADSDRHMPLTVKATLTENQMNRIKERARGLGITLNDLFMAAYAQAMKKMLPLNKRDIKIPCPANLRKYGKDTEQLTIANMTGNFVCPVNLSQNYGIEEMAVYIHENMLKQKTQYECFKGLALLEIAYAFLPISIARILIKRFYTIEPISYTNVGLIDEEKLLFDGLEITECYVCGMYRPAPSFQLSISTYNNVCTLASNLLCTQKQKDAGARVIHQVVSELISM